MTCVFDSMYNKVVRGRYHNISNIRQMVTHLKLYKDMLLPFSMQVNGVALSNKQRNEAKTALQQLRIGDGYLMSSFDPLYMYCAWVFKCRITHRWRLNAVHIGRKKHAPKTITTVYEDTSQASAAKQVSFSSTATHTE